MATGIPGTDHNRAFLKTLCPIDLMSIGSIRAMCRPLETGTDGTKILNMLTKPLIQGCAQGLVTVSQRDGKKCQVELYSKS